VAVLHEVSSSRAVCRNLAGIYTAAHQPPATQYICMQTRLQLFGIQCLLQTDLLY
jgi:hypothetical protein